MKRRLVLALILGTSLGTSAPLFAVLTSEQRARFDNLNNHANELTDQTGPHVFDGQIPAWAAELAALFPRIHQSALPSYEAARDRLLAGARAVDGLPGQSTSFPGESYEVMIGKRLNNPTGALADATRTLLPMAIAVTPNEGALRNLVQSCNPINPSHSAIYNVFFKWTVHYLAWELQQEQNDPALQEALALSTSLQEQQPLPRQNEEPTEEELEQIARLMSLEPQNRNVPEDEGYASGDDELARALEASLLLNAPTGRVNTAEEEAVIARSLEEARRKNELLRIEQLTIAEAIENSRRLDAPVTPAEDPEVAQFIEESRRLAVWERALGLVLLQDPSLEATIRELASEGPNPQLMNSFFSNPSNRPLPGESEEEILARQSNTLARHISSTL